MMNIFSVRALHFQGHNTGLQRGRQSRAVRWQAYWLASLLGVAMLGGWAHAESPFTFSGFGTLGASYESQQDLSFLRDNNQSKNPALNTSFITDSIIGAQLSYSISHSFRATTQLVLRDSVVMDLNTATELAFIGYRPTPDIDLRLGRVAVDMFKLSDFRRVDYVNLWARPPTELYGWILPTYLNGGDISYSTLSGDYFWRTKFQFGSTKPKLNSPDGNDIFPTEFNQFAIGTLSMDVNNWRTRVSFAQFETADSSPGFVKALEGISMIPSPVGQEAALFVDQLSDTAKETVQYFQAAVSYDSEHWVIDSEYAQVTSRSSLIPDGGSGYLSLGHRIDRFTPYVIASKFFPKKSPIASTADWDSLPGFAPLRDAALGAINGSLIDQQTLSVGVRWDIAPKTALKAQWDHTQVQADGYALWAYENRRNTERADVDVVTFTLNFIF